MRNIHDTTYVYVEYFMLVLRSYFTRLNKHVKATNSTQQVDKEGQVDNESIGLSFDQQFGGDIGQGSERCDLNVA